MRLKQTITFALLLSWMVLGLAFPMMGCSMIGTDKPIQLSLPKPTGNHNVGITELHLVDQDRMDTWANGKKRELMISIWYPAKKGYQGKRAPYMRPKVAKEFGAKLSETLNVKPEQVDWTQLETNAWLDAPIDNQLGPRPIILFSPGGNLPRTSSTAFVEELASHGYVVVTIDHTYETDVEFPNGRLEKASVPQFSKEVIQKVSEERKKDTLFVLEQLAVLKSGKNPDANQRKLPDGFSQLLDVQKIGMFGHSVGGYTTVQVMDGDSRIHAGMNMDGSLGYEEKSGQVTFPAAPNGLKRPILLLTADENTHRLSPSLKLFWSKTSGWKKEINIPKGEHFTFTDNQVFIPQIEQEIDLPKKVIRQSIGTTQNAQRVLTSTRMYITAFFDLHLQQKPQKLFDGPSPKHPDVQLVS